MNLVHRRNTNDRSFLSGKSSKSRGTAETGMARGVTRRRALGVVGALGTLGALSACGLSGENVFGGEHDGIIVGSAAFAESQILAEIYSQALNKNGFKSSTQLGIGARKPTWGRSPPGLLT